MVFHFNGKLFHGNNVVEIRGIFESVTSGREGGSISKPKPSYVNKKNKLRPKFEILMSHEQMIEEEQSYSDAGKTWSEVKNECV
jgi:hypothetical protein